MKSLPDPDEATISYTRAAIDLLAAASDDSDTFGAAAKNAPKNASWTEQLMYIPDELFATAFDMLSNYQDSPIFYEEENNQSSTPQMLAERIMQDHILNFGFFEALTQLVRYAEPATSERHANNLI